MFSCFFLGGWVGGLYGNRCTWICYNLLIPFHDNFVSFFFNALLIYTWHFFGFGPIPGILSQCHGRCGWKTTSPIWSNLAAGWWDPCVFNTQPAQPKSPTFHDKMLVEKCWNKFHLWGGFVKSCDFFLVVRFSPGFSWMRLLKLLNQKGWSGSHTHMYIKKSLRYDTWVGRWRWQITHV